MIRRARLLDVLACLALPLLAAAGCDHAAPAVAARQDPAPAADRVVAGKPEKKTLSLFTSQPGQVAAFEETPLFARLSGYVDKVLVDIGDRVEKGQTLLTIAIPEMQDELEQKRALVAQAEAELAQAEANVDGAKAAVETAEARVAHAEAGVARAKGELDRWRAEHSRIKELAAARSVTSKLVDETLNQFRGSEAASGEALAAVQSSRALVSEARVHVRKTEADAGAAAARLRVAKANLAYATTMLEYTAIKAPYRGAVTRRLVATGDYVGPAMGSAGPARPTLVVVRTDVVRVFVEVPELEAAWVNEGDKASVRVQALEEKSYDAAVTRNSWSLDPTNRSLRTEIDIPNPAGALRPGMFATATILLEERPGVLTLPAAAIVREGSEYFCCVIERGKIERRKIEIGLRGGADVEIVSGLAPDQTVALTHVASLRTGQSVEVAAPEKK